ncbi:MAG: ATP-dependent DNA helicase RecG [Holosporaceae bacterium]|jgi:ATP-dependent DNA helicase RecG|nr:ATP-dependent DNA helicase RecG [Holosporaceae bacterium]
MKDFLLQPFDKFLKLSDFTLKCLKKCCLGNRVIDLLFHFPTAVRIRSGDINNFKDKLSVVLKIAAHVPPRRRGAPYKVFGHTQEGDKVVIVYFNCRAPFIRKILPTDGVFTVSGSASFTAEGVQITHPDAIAPPTTLQYWIGPEAVYPLTARLTNRTVRYAENCLLKILPEIPDPIPPRIRNEYGLPSFTEALRKIHAPRTPEDLLPSHPARLRIAIDELLTGMIRLKQIRESASKHAVEPFFPTNEITGRLQLPFELTEDQKSCLEDIRNDLASGKPMNRLIQGDVGSGKTIVALIAMLIVLENHAQAALLVPTEILAIQHFNNIKKICENLGIKTDVMLGANRRTRLRQTEELKNGTTQILTGTHALLEEEIEFENLKLAVIDEQHRFGVLQRLSLIKKCRYPHVLVMSATPIPRTLLLGCYGDLDVSTIRTKPPGRKPIKTVVIGISKIDELLEKLQKRERQIYWVCPVIEESENLTDINTRREYLEKFFPPEEIRILHGKMKAAEKDHVIGEFKTGKFKILVSTTVIEVGVDIPGADVMVIEHAERFGLAQLHQLRGRVGRGTEESHCILLYHRPISETGRQRLRLMKNTDDGFLLSEEDLKLRGAGDVLGKEQSGFTSLRFGNFADNEDSVKTAEKILRSVDFTPEDVRFFCDIFNKLNDNIIA